MTVVGPLTTTFQAPSSCTTPAPQLYQVRSGSSSSYVQGPLFTKGSDCFPKGYDPAPSNYYSPGWCPAGYTTACSSLASVSTATETAVICCPTQFSYTCLAPTGLGQPSLGCTTTWSAVLAVLGVTVVSDGKVGTSTVVSETANGITAYGIQVRFKSGDPTPAPRPDESGFSVVTRTSARSSIPIPTQLLVPAQTDPPSSSGGVSTPAAIGIGVGSAVAALLLASVACLFFFLRRRRKKRQTKPVKHLALPPPVPPKELPATPVPRHTVPLRYELPEQAPSRRPSMAASKRHMSMSPASALGRTPTAGRGERGGRGDSGVLAGYYLAVELEAPSEVSFKDRATPESASSGWTDRQMRGATMPMPWI